jgi:hypothetical protein
VTRWNGSHPVRRVPRSHLSPSEPPQAATWPWPGSIETGHRSSFLIMKPFWVTVVARPAVGLLAREVRAEMTALFTVTATPAPRTGLVRTNNKDAACASRWLSGVGEAAPAAVIKPLRTHHGHVARAHCSRPPPGRPPTRTGRLPGGPPRDLLRRHPNHPTAILTPGIRSQPRMRVRRPTALAGYRQAPPGTGA